jgi:superfamily II DNA helicase RecQ
MKVKVFSIPAVGDEYAEECVNEFLARHRIAQIDRQLVNDGAGSYWTVCVGYWQPDAATTSRTKKNRVDYREVLDEPRFREYAALRDWRKKVAESEGVPVFTVFTNEQLAHIVRLASPNLKTVSSIEGIGKSKLEQYATLVLEELARHRQASGFADA